MSKRSKADQEQAKAEAERQDEHRRDMEAKIAQGKVKLIPWEEALSQVMKARAIDLRRLAQVGE